MQLQIKQITGLTSALKVPFTVSELAPTSPVENQVWLNPNDLSLQIYINNGSFLVWEVINGSQGTDDLIINNQSSNYTLLISDRNAYIRIASATAATCTLPANADVAFPVGTCIVIGQIGDGKVGIVPASGVSLNYPADRTAETRVKNSTLTLVKVDTDTWDVSGDLHVSVVDYGSL